MPNDLPSVPHFEQSRDGACLPACVRMVLAHWGQSHSEEELVKLLGTKVYGTPISHVKRLSRQGFLVEVASLTEEQLRNHLTAEQPIIVRVWTAMLDYWRDEITSHVVVAVGFDETFVYLNDPALPHAPQPVSWDSFLAAWAEFDETAVIIYRA